MQVELVLGSICCGKTTFMTRYDPDKAVVVRIGKFLRESIGLKAMAADPNPNACNVTEYWVRWIVRGALNCAHQLKRPVIFDGYPRTISQAHWLASVLQDDGPYEPRVIVHHLAVDDATLVKRMTERKGVSEESAAFDKLRLQMSKDQVTEVLDFIMKNWNGNLLESLNVHA